jgi:hypothetical protein
LSYRNPIATINPLVFIKLIKNVAGVVVSSIYSKMLSRLPRKPASPEQLPVFLKLLSAWFLKLLYVWFRQLQNALTLLTSPILKVSCLHFIALSIICLTLLPYSTFGQNDTVQLKEVDIYGIKPSNHHKFYSPHSAVDN